MSVSPLEWLAPRARALDEYMAPLFADAWPEPFGECMAYPLFGGGKRMRPALCFAAYEAIAKDPEDWDRILPAAAAVELVHTYSLVHDDLPAMDDDDVRRGRPTVHKKWDEATAILVGDALLTEAFAVLTRSPLPAETSLALIALLANAAGFRGMIGGQVADIDNQRVVTDLDTLTRLHRLKTGALFRFCTLAGAMVGEGSPIEKAALEGFGTAIGLAFQLADDVLDEDQDAGEDGNPSFVKWLGTDGTRRRAAQLADEARGLVSALPRPEPLLALARYIVERDI